MSARFPHSVSLNEPWEEVLNKVMDASGQKEGPTSIFMIGLKARAQELNIPIPKEDDNAQSLRRSRRPQA